MNPISHTLDEQTVFQRLARRALNQKDSRVKHSLLEDISNRTKFPLLPNTSVFIDRKGNYLNDSKDQSQKPEEDLKTSQQSSPCERGQSIQVIKQGNKGYARPAEGDFDKILFSTNFMNDKNDLKDIEDVISEIQSVLNMQKSDIDHNEVKTRQHRQLQWRKKDYRSPANNIDKLQLLLLNYPTSLEPNHVLEESVPLKKKKIFGNIDEPASKQFKQKKVKSEAKHSLQSMQTELNNKVSINEHSQQQLLNSSFPMATSLHFSQDTNNLNETGVTENNQY